MNYLGGNPFIIPSPTPNCSTMLGGPWTTGHSAPGSPSREKTNHSHFPSLAQGLMKKTGPSSPAQHSCFWVFRGNCLGAGSRPSAVPLAQGGGRDPFFS